jgi:Ni2+-binding GTPase involved in maturation of urease and hydrogenase
MNKLKLYLVGGFLGSGKTTAIQQASKQLHHDKKKVGVITNDQGTQQVDTLFIKGHNIPSEEVSGGCFCCNYNDLEKSISSLQDSERPDIIFAESVGSCTDLAATVINPLLSFNPDQYEIVLSVFTDIRLLVKFLQGSKDIFYDNVNYIYEKQLEEADIIVVNKIDLLTDEQLKLAKKIITATYKSKTIIYQNSLSVKDIQQWLTVCSGLESILLRPTPEIDYDVYGAGEAELAWLDEEIGIVTEDNSAVAAGYALINNIYDKVTGQGYPIGHLKFLMDDGKEQWKRSFSSIAAPSVDTGSHPETDRIIILINARVQVTPALLQKMVADAIIETEFATGCKIIENKFSSFKPGYPKPTHRITKSIK